LLVQKGKRRGGEQKTSAGETKLIRWATTSLEVSEKSSKGEKKKEGWERGECKNY